MIQIIHRCIAPSTLLASANDVVLASRETGKHMCASMFPDAPVLGQRQLDGVITRSYSMQQIVTHTVSVLQIVAASPSS